MNKIKHNKTPAEKRKLRVRAKVQGTNDRPRLSVFKSNRYLYLQVIDDQKGMTLLASNALNFKKAKQKLTGSKTEQAKQIALDLIKKLKSKKITALKFDRGAYKYHGRLKAVAEQLRAAKIKI